MRRVGVLMNRAASDPEGQARVAAFKMQQLGWSERLNVQRALHLRRIGGRAGIGAVSTPVVKIGYVDHRIHDASAVRIIRARSELR
jgi:hypothetical protein